MGDGGIAAVHYLVAAVIATQASTLWNFGLTEGWVFGKRTTERSFVMRLVSFLLMNNGMLLLRGPIATLDGQPVGRPLCGCQPGFPVCHDRPALFIR